MEISMCLAVPARVVEIDGASAKVDIMGNRRKADLGLLDDVAIGDFILIHAGFGIHKLDREEAEATLDLFKEMEKHSSAGARH